MASGLVGATIKGTVTDAQNGAKLAGMSVAAYDAAGNQQALATTDSSGKYTLSGLTGELRLLAYDGGGVYATTFAGNAESFETSPTVSGDRSGYDFVLIRGVVVTGTVTGANGQSITVAAYNLSGTRRAFRNLATSTYQLVLPPGSYKLAAFDAGRAYATSFYSDQAGFPTATVVTLNSPGPRTGIDFHLRLAAHLTGTVVDAQSHVPLSGLLVSAYTTEGSILATTLTDFLGRFQLDVPDGTVRLLAADPSLTYATGFFGGANSFAQTPNLTLAPGESRADLTIEIERGGFVAGRISAAGKAVCCITVAAYNADGSQRATIRTDVNGGYQMVLPAAEFRIGAYDDAQVYSPKFYANATTFRAATPVTVTRFQTTAPVDLSLDRAGRVAGNISDSVTGGAVASIVVSAYDADGYLAAMTTTSASGAYTLALAAGTYRVVASDPLLRYPTTYPQSAPTFEDSPSYVLAPDTTTSVVFTLTKGTRITGTVVDASRTALSGVEIGVLASSGNRVATTTAQNGSFTLVLPTGIYKLIAIDPRGRYLPLFFNSSSTFANATPVTVSASGSTPGTLTFILIPALRRRAAAH